MPDVETIMEPWMGDQQDKEMPDFENADLLTAIDGVCGTCSFDVFILQNIHYFRHYTAITCYGLGHYSHIICYYQSEFAGTIITIRLRNRNRTHRDN